MYRYLLEVLILLQGIVLGWFLFSLSDEALANPALIIRSEFLMALCIFAFITYISFRLDWSARILYQRRAANIIESRRRLHRSHKALQQLARSQAQHGDKSDFVMRDICETAVQALEVSAVSIWMFEREQSRFTRTIVFAAEGGLSTERIDEQVPEDSLYMQDLNENRLVSIIHARSDPRSKQFYSVVVENTFSVLDAPIYLDGELVAILSLDQRRKERHWTTEEENFTSSLADLATLVLESERRRKTEVELRRRSMAIESALDGMAILNKDEQFVYLNDAHAKVYGYQSTDELLGQHWGILYSEAERERFEIELLPELQKYGSVCAEAIGRRKTGEFFPQEVILTAIPGDGLICTVRDISARKEAENKLIESKHFLRTVIDADPHLIFVKDRQGRFTLANQAVATLYGTSVDQLVGRKDSDFNGKHEELDKFCADDLKVITEGKELFITEELVTDHDGTEHVFQTIKRPLYDASTGQTHVLGVASDITQLKHLHQQLVQAQKMEAIGQLAGGIAHDFNNLLTGILGYADLLETVSKDPEQVEHAADMISGAARRASELTDKLLGFARKGKNQNIPVDMHRVIREALRLIERTLEKNILVVEQLAAASAFVKGDPVQIEQVILNLVINARDAIASSSQHLGKSKITIATALVTLGGNTSVQDLPIGRYLQIAVSDNGCGIPEEYFARVFEPFFTTKENGKGTGMGLAMVYGIVRNHGGAIEVESKQGEGATFRMYLPLSEAKQAPLRVPTPANIKPGHGRILIVDDNPVIRDVTKEMLTVLGYEVTTVENGVEAVYYFKRNKSRCDLVLLDMVMPKMSARECIAMLKRIDPAIKIVLSTGYGKNESVQQLLDSGLAGFIQKPYQMIRLSEVVSAALAVGRAEVANELSV